MLVAIIAITWLLIEQRERHERFKSLLMVLIKGSQFHGKWSYIEIDGNKIYNHFEQRAKQFPNGYRSNDQTLAITQEQVAKKKRVFDEFDLDHDLILNLNELKALEMAMKEAMYRQFW